MLITCWSAKGGSGCSVVAAALALTWARHRPPVLLVDWPGDLITLLDLTGPEPRAGGLTEWASAGPDVPADGIARLEVDVAPGLTLLPRGGDDDPPVRRVQVLAGLLAEGGRPVIVDAGLLRGETPVLPLVTAADRSLLVTRPCFLALRRMSTVPCRPGGVVLIEEPGRALDHQDVEEVAGAPVVARIGVDPAVARAVDAGLLTRRLPRSLQRALGPVVQ